MRIGDFFKRLFPARVQGSSGDVSDANAALAEEYGASEQRSVDEARIESGGGGALGFPAPGSHMGPGDEIAESESRSE
jgi:hypothetical protein